MWTIHIQSPVETFQLRQGVKGYSAKEAASSLTPRPLVFYCVGTINQASAKTAQLDCG